MFGSQAEHARAEGAVSLKNSASSLRFIRVLRFKINIPQRVPAPVSGLCTIGQPGSRCRFCPSTSHLTRSPSSHFCWLRASKRESATNGGECGVSKDIYISSESKFVPAKFHAVDDAKLWLFLGGMSITFLLFRCMLRDISSSNSSWVCTGAELAAITPCYGRRIVPHQWGITTCQILISTFFDPVSCQPCRHLSCCEGSRLRLVPVFLGCSIAHSNVSCERRVQPIGVECIGLCLSRLWRLPMGFACAQNTPNWNLDICSYI
jgi:hypothetical protein